MTVPVLTPLCVCVATYIYLTPSPLEVEEWSFNDQSSVFWGDRTAGGPGWLLCLCEPPYNSRSPGACYIPTLSFTYLLTLEFKFGYIWSFYQGPGVFQGDRSASALLLIVLLVVVMPPPPSLSYKPATPFTYMKPHTRTGYTIFHTSMVEYFLHHHLERHSSPRETYKICQN